MLKEKMESVAVKRRLVILIGSIIGVFVVGGLLLFLHQYSSVLSDVSQQTLKNPAQQNAVDLAEIKQKYDTDFPRIIGDYLSADASSPNFSSLTENTRNKILALRVPGLYKDTHLAAVLDLSEIETALAKGDSKQVQAKLQALERINKKFLDASK